MDYNINFPHLGIYMDHVGKLININGFTIAYYGIVVVIGILAGVWMALSEAKRTGQDVEMYMDFAIYEVIFCIIGARLYYVIFSWDKYKDDLLSIFNLRQGGLAIYGAVIMCLVVCLVYTKVKKLDFLLLCDTGVVGLPLGQLIGRYGNFFNREAFGRYTDSLFAMQLPVTAVRASDVTIEQMENVVNVNGIDYIQVHPTFLYESLWNLALFLFLILFVRYRKVFKGQVMLVYLGGYGLGRFFIESLRTDQLKIPGTDIAVSMVVAMTLVVLSVILNIVGIVKAKINVAADGGSEPEGGAKVVPGGDKNKKDIKDE
ncbi:MAG: prolipoprotein diacylglyceryl transferase [Lachnospiraceae bacterium]|nr:prolipoprotein diacylglyceryl transferase [Lachnospiraceae bacterium]